jgi:GT2 family glycosyltransferase
MNILICCLVYESKSFDIIHKNLENAGMPFNVIFINKLGIANAMNDGIDYALEQRLRAKLSKKMSVNESCVLFDAIAFLSNDIIEPQNWLVKKANSLRLNPVSGIVASSLDAERKEIKTEVVFSNWLVSMDLIDKIGYFNESYFPYGAIDHEYCVRALVAGFRPHYALDCLASHNYDTANSVDKYGYNKLEILSKFEEKLAKEMEEYENGSRDVKIASRLP